MQTVQGSTDGAANGCGISNCVDRGAMEVGREDNGVGIAVRATIGTACMRSDSDYRARRSAKHCLCRRAKHQPLEAVEGIGSQDHKVHIARARHLDDLHWGVSIRHLAAARYPGLSRL